MMRKKTTFRILFIALALLAVAGLTGLLLQQYLNSKIKDLFIRELNKQLTTEVKVDEVRLSLFRDFPYASVRFKGVTLKESDMHPPKEDLLKAGLISLRFSLLDLLHSRFTVTNILVKDAGIKVHIFRDGSDNYHFWKESKEKGGKEFSIDIQKILLQETRITYLDESSAVEGRFALGNMEVKGDFSKETFLLRLKGNLFTDRFIVNNTVYASKREADLDLAMDVNTRVRKYNFRTGNLTLNELSLQTTGWVDQEKQQLDLKISGSETTLKDLVSVLPDKYGKKLKEYRFEGDASVVVFVKGFYGSECTPAVNAQLVLSGGKIGRAHSDVEIEGLNLTATYNLGPNGINEQLNISRMKASIRNGTIEGNLSIKELSAPLIMASLKADIGLEDARELLRLDTITSLKGRLKLDIRFEGRISDIQNPAVADLEGSRLSGRAIISEGELGLKGYSLPVKEVNSQVTFSNEKVRLDQFSCHLGKSDFAAKGNVGNLLAWILIKNQKLNIDGLITSNRLDWDELSGNSTGSGEYNFGLPGDIILDNVQLNVKNFTFRKFSASYISARLQMRDRNLLATSILLKSMQGIVSGQASINAASGKYALLQCKATVNKVNIKSLFQEFGDFGNTDLTYKNLDGAVSGDVIFAASMQPNLDIDLQSVKTHADVRVENGRLVNYSPMLGLSKFLRVEDLSDIRFATMQNQIDIANRIIYIPSMQIKSSAIDLSLMGTHTFSNELEYHFSIALADLMAAKFRKRNPSYDRQSEFGPVEDDGRGRTMVLVSMTGTVDNPVFSYDKKAVREKISNELKNQKVELKEAFKKEFGTARQDSLRSPLNKKEKDIQKKQEDGKFVIEWDDDKKVE